MIKAIIFDCFGVLAEDGWLPFKRKYIGENAELAQAISDLGKQNEYGMVTNDEYFRQVADLIGVDEETLKQAVNRRVPNEELFDFIKKELKTKYKIGLLSNANYDVVHELFTPEQAALFDASVMSYESKLIKPDRRMFDLISVRIGVPLEECVFIDDVERYCVAAEEFGMMTILYESPMQVKQALDRFMQPT